MIICVYNYVSVVQFNNTIARAPAWKEIVITKRIDRIAGPR